MYDVPLEHYCARLGRNPSSNIKFEAFLRQLNAKHYIKDHFYVSLENNFEIFRMIIIAQGSMCPKIYYTPNICTKLTGTRSILTYLLAILVKVERGHGSDSTGWGHILKEKQIHQMSSLGHQDWSLVMTNCSCRCGERPIKKKSLSIAWLRRASSATQDQSLLQTSVLPLSHSTENNLYAIYLILSALSFVTPAGCGFLHMACNEQPTPQLKTTKSHKQVLS